jgi:hypothetical protein
MGVDSPCSRRVNSLSKSILRLEKKRAQSTCPFFSSSENLMDGLARVYRLPTTSDAVEFAWSAWMRFS